MPKHLPIRLKPHERRGLSPLAIVLWEDLSYMSRLDPFGHVRISLRALCDRLERTKPTVLQARRELVSHGLLRLVVQGQRTAAYQPLAPRSRLPFTGPWRPAHD